MQFKSEQKICPCGRTNDHEHQTLDWYVIHEKDQDGNTISEVMAYCYDDEDNEIYEKVKKLREDVPEHKFTFFKLKSQKI